MNVGYDVLGITIKALYFALINSFIGFFIYHKGANIGYLINDRLIAQDIIELIIKLYCFNIIYLNYCSY